MIYKKIIKPILFSLEAEDAHNLAIRLASAVNQSVLLQNVVNTVFGLTGKNLERKLFGLTFPNPVGLAAGFDKNGVMLRAMQALGFGFVEVGSITAEPSAGNPRPRAFRLPEDKSLINRMGLNNDGAQVIINRIKNNGCDIPTGINIAKTNDPDIHGKKALEDYAKSYSMALGVADYITINISCPNTGEGKTFEDPAALQLLLERLNPTENSTPTLVKFSVDTDKTTLASLVNICESFGIAGYVAANTSSSRKGLKTPDPVLKNIGNGGLSGEAISTASTRIITWLRQLLDDSKPIIGVGGIHDADSVKEKIDAGADLIQVYTGLVYEGPGLVKKLKKELLIAN